MTSKRATSKSTAASKLSAEMRPNSGDDTTWAHGPSTFGKSAPGDALYDSLGDFVLDQSEGEESSEDAGRTEKSSSGDLEQNKVSEADGGIEEAAGSSSRRNESKKNDNQAPSLSATTKRKHKRVAYAADEEIVLYLLHQHVSLEHRARAEIFNRVFRGQEVVREKGALVMQWHRFKADYEKKFATLSTAELAEHEAWKTKIDNAVRDAGMASHSYGNQDNTSDSADDQASQLTTPKPKQPRRPRESSQPREPRAKYTADHDIVLRILRDRKGIDAGTLAEVFNHVFRHEGVVRDKVALCKHWGRFKDVIQKRLDKLSPAELAQHEAWKKKVDDAIEELSQ